MKALNPFWTISEWSHFSYPYLIPMFPLGLKINSAYTGNFHRVPDVILPCKRFSRDRLERCSHIMSNVLKTLFIFNGKTSVCATLHISGNEFLHVPHIVRPVQVFSLSIDSTVGGWKARLLHVVDTYLYKSPVQSFMWLFPKWCYSGM